jgi:predicted nucleotidyltransferase
VRPVHVSVFGSTARSDGDAASDIDVLILNSHEVAADDETWRAQIDDPSRDAHPALDR